MAAKEITFGWCLTGKHRQCRKQYGQNIKCICPCEDHGADRVADEKLSQQQVKDVVARINASQYAGGTTREDWTRDGYVRVQVKPNYDADTIEELERRRRK